MAHNLIPINLDKDTGKLVAKPGVGGGGPAGSVAGYLHNQAIASTSWTIVHNVGTTNAVVQIFDNSGELIIPDKVTLVSINIIQVEFGAAMAGNSHIIFFPNPI